jgi:hypothetical protein
MRHAAGRVLRALSGRDAGFGRARLAPQLPPAGLAAGLRVASVVAPRERWGGCCSPLRRETRHVEAGDS